MQLLRIEIIEHKAMGINWINKGSAKKYVKKWLTNSVLGEKNKVNK